jgi:hypothetical protein
MDRIKGAFGRMGAAFTPSKATVATKKETRSNIQQLEGQWNVFNYHLGTYLNSMVDMRALPD